MGKSSQGPVLEFSQVPALLVMTVTVTGNPAKEITGTQVMKAFGNAKGVITFHSCQGLEVAISYAYYVSQTCL